MTAAIWYEGSIDERIIFSQLPVITCNPLDQPRLDSAGRAVPGVSLRVVSLETGAPARRRGAADRGHPWTIAVDGAAVDARGAEQLLTLSGNRLLAGRVGAELPGADLTRRSARVLGPLEPAGELSGARAGRWLALALVATCADLVGTARGAHALACDYAKVRTQYGKTIGSYQAVAHPLAEGLALVEGSVSVLRYAAWAVDELRPAEAIRTAQIAKVYCARAARDICETAVQVHGGIGNTWDCLVHVFLRRALASVELFAVRLEEIDCGLS